MAAIAGEELLATEAEAGEGLEASESNTGRFQYSGGGLGGVAYRGDAIGFERFRTPKNYISDYKVPETSSSPFKADEKPQGLFNNLLGRDPNIYDLYGADYAQGKTEKGVKEILEQVNAVYNGYRESKKYKNAIKDNADARRRVGIVFIGKENRDQLIRSNKMPAYYSTSNIKSLLRRGIMPFGWNTEMAVEQGFGKEVFAQEQKAVTERNSKHLLERQQRESDLRKSLGELENLRDRLKTRKILEYYNQN